LSDGRLEGPRWRGIAEKMSNNDSSHKNSSKDVSKDVSKLDDKASTRRRFIKGAISTTPVILSLANRPAWGTDCSLSGIMSATHASHHDTSTSCNNMGSGCTPGFWKQNAKAWRLTGCKPGNCKESDDDDDDYKKKHKRRYKRSYKSGWYTVNGCRTKNGCKDYDNTGTKFSEIFGAGYSSETCMQMLHRHPGSLEFHAIAAVFNCMAFPSSYGYTASYIVEVYQRIVDEGDGAKISALHDTLDYLNNRGCPINAHGEYSDD